MIWTAALSCLLLGACFEDEGNYDYKPSEAPQWKIESNSLIRISCRAGDGEIVNFNGGDYYTWASDSVARAAEVRYEWKLNGVVFATEPSVKMPTDEFIKKAKITSYDSHGLSASFAIIEKETEIVYMMPVLINIAKPHAIGDLVVLSEKADGGSKLSFIKRSRTELPDGTRPLQYELKDNYYEEVNSEGLAGSPRSLVYTYGANNVSEVGSLSVLTSEGAYEVNPETFLKVQNLQDDFTGATPDNLKVVDRQDAWGGPDGQGGLHSYMATEDGRVFVKMMTKNNLGGKFQSSPYVIDGKGYKITRFGSTQVGYNCIPCYDELNRRVLAILFQESGESTEMWPGGPSFPTGTQYRISKIYPVKQPSIPVANVPPVENMPADTEMLQIGLCGMHYSGFTGPQYYGIGMVYNTGGKTMLAECAIVGDKSGWGELGNPSTWNNFNTLREFPGGNLDESSQILFASYGREGYYPQVIQNYMLYTKGHELFCLDRSNDFNKSFTITLPDSSDKITGLKWAVYNDYDELLIGTEKGKIYCYSNLSGLKPELSAQLDVQGKVVDFKELYNYSNGSSRDNY